MEGKPEQTGIVSFKCCAVYEYRKQDCPSSALSREPDGGSGRSDMPLADQHAISG